MGAIAVSSNGQWVSLALESDSGEQVLLVAPGEDLSDWELYQHWPDGEAVNVITSPSAVLQALYYGDLGEDYYAVRFNDFSLEDATAYPALCNAAVYSRSSAQRLVATFGADIYQTFDATHNWEMLLSAAGEVTALAAVFRSGKRELSIAFVASGSTLEYLAPAGNLVDMTGGGGLADVAGICSLELVR